MCVLRVIVWPETCSLSMACFVGVLCVCTFDRYIIYMCSRNTQEPSLHSERAAARARARSHRAGGGVQTQTGIDRERPSTRDGEGH